MKHNSQQQLSASTLPVPPPVAPEHTLTAAQWGMTAFLVSEVAFFGTLIATYIALAGNQLVGPTPAEALSLPLAVGTTLCLLSSSVSVHFAEHAFRRDRRGKFLLLWGATIVLGLAFLAGTAYEWHDLIVNQQLTISRNLFGTTFYTLVGFHGLHVSAGIVAMLIVLGLAWRRAVTAEHETGVQLVSWYWHFVDGVWIVVFLVVYVASRSGSL